MSLQELQAGMDWGQIARTIINTAIRKIKDASTTVAGLVRLATNAETTTGTSTTLATTPAGVNAVVVALLAGLRGHIAGLTLSNNAGDATNDIDIAVGVATASDQSAVISLGSALTKQLDASWAVGTNAGMRASGAAITDTTYHIFLIRRPDTGVVDIAADTSASGANIAANTNAAYTQMRRIGSIVRTGGTIKAFKQVGDVFKWNTSAVDRNSASAAASGLLALTIPAGIVVAPLLIARLFIGASVNCQINVGDAAVGSANVQVVQAVTGAGDSNDFVNSNPPPAFYSNTSSQIYFSQTNTAGTPSSSELITYGWVDHRGKND